jgi:hypothetical protein
LVIKTAKLSYKLIRRTRSLEKYKKVYFFNLYLPYNEKYIGKKVKAYLVNNKIVIDLKDKPQLFEQQDAVLIGTYTIFRQKVKNRQYAKIRVSYKDELVEKYGIKDKYKYEVKLPYVTIYVDSHI